MTGAAPGQPRQPRQRRGQPQAGAARRGGAGDRGGQEQDAAGRRAQGGAAADKVEDSVASYHVPGVRLARPPGGEAAQVPRVQLHQGEVWSSRL